MGAGQLYYRARKRENERLVYSKLDELSQKLSGFEDQLVSMEIETPKLNFSDAIGLIGKFVTLGTLIIFGNVLKAFGLGLTEKDITIILQTIGPDSDLDVSKVIDSIIITGDGLVVVSYAIWFLLALWIIFIFVGRASLITSFFALLISIISLGMGLGVFMFAQLSSAKIIEQNPVANISVLQKSYNEKNNPVTPEGIK